MRRFLVLISICLMWLTACKSKKVAIQESKLVVKENLTTEKDSAFQQKNKAQTAIFEFSTSQHLEMELTSDKDSTGRNKEVIFERIRSPSSEKIIVRGGTLRLRTADNSVQRSSQYSNNTEEKGIIRTHIQEHKTAESKASHKEKTVKASGVSVTFWLLLIIVLVALFLAWKLKLIRALRILNPF